MTISDDGKSICLSDGVLSGTTLSNPDSSEFPFNRGLPSWNGIVPDHNGSFKILMRFYNSGWSPWLTVGYWKNNLWTSYGNTNYSGGEVDIDYITLNSYFSKWQFQVTMKRTAASVKSPTLHKLSFFISDQRTTDNINITSVVNDKPQALFIPTQHFYQYAIDDEIGGSICSPTSVSMVLRSYDIKVDPLTFARATYDDYWGIFGVWPRVVQNAAEYGLNGAVTRYRSWSQARETLASGGCVVMSVGLPLYTGHLIMLAGFDANGNPLVHDPAKSNGYKYKFNKTELSKSWFGKGGVSYTFFPEDTSGTTPVENKINYPQGYFAFDNYPNPFNSETNLRFETSEGSFTSITVYDITGREIAVLFYDYITPGSHRIKWNAGSLPTGNYFINVRSGKYTKTIKVLLLK